MQQQTHLPHTHAHQRMSSHNASPTMQRSGDLLQQQAHAAAGAEAAGPDASLAAALKQVAVPAAAHTQHMHSVSRADAGVKEYVQSGVHGGEGAAVAGLPAVPLHPAQQHPYARVPPSYGASVYRDFLQSASASVAASRMGSRRESLGGATSAYESSAASSHAGTAMASLAASGTSTQVHSRDVSPTRKFEHGPGTGVIYHPPTARDVALAYAQAASVQAVQALPAAHSQPSHPTQAFPLPPHHPGEGQLSLAGLSMAQPHAEDDDDAPVVHVRSRAVLRPRHFTFAEADVIKSFKRSSEKEKARQERERARAREMQLQALQEQERAYLLALKQQREQAMRDAAIRRSQQQQVYERQRRRDSHILTSDTDSGGEDSDASGYSSEEEDPNSPALLKGERPHSPLRPPSHFKFDMHDLRKSYSKPSHRQQIGHWSTFPRSSTVVYPASQLLAYIRHKRDNERMQAMEASPRHQYEGDGGQAQQTQQAQQQQFKQQQQQQRAAIRHQFGESHGSLSSRGLAPPAAQAHISQGRRASMPAAISSSVLVTSSSAGPSTAGSAVLPAFMRSTSHRRASHTMSAPHLAPLDSNLQQHLHARVTQARRHHARSSTVGSTPVDQQPVGAASSQPAAVVGGGASLDKSAATADPKHRSGGSLGGSSEKQTHIRRGSSAGVVHGSLVGTGSLEVGGQLAAVRPPHRRSAMPLSVSASVSASAPSSPHHPAAHPAQVHHPAQHHALAQSRLANARERSAHLQAQPKAATLPATAITSGHPHAHAHNPPPHHASHTSYGAPPSGSGVASRARLLQGVDSKHASAAPSPKPAAHSRLQSYSTDASLPMLPPYGDGKQHADAWSAAGHPSATSAAAPAQQRQPPHSHAKYTHVPSSGYGQTQRR